jgi:hypothetical protein
MIDIETRAVRQYWLDDLDRRPPSPHGTGDVVITYSAAAEASFYHAMDWVRPDHVVDLWAEFMALTNNRPPEEGHSLTGCLTHFGLHHPFEAEKKTLQARCWQGPPFTDDKRAAIMAYNFSDTEVMIELLARFARVARWQRYGHARFPKAALFRGLYSWATYHVQRHGIPVDAELVQEIRERFPLIRPSVLRRMDTFGLLDDDGVLKAGRVNEWVLNSGIVGWPRTTKTKNFRTDEETLDRLRAIHPGVRSIAALLKLRRGSALPLMAPDSDGRQRPRVMPFGGDNQGRTGRNQPKGSEHIFMASRGFRHVIRPPDGRALIYADQKGQEFAVAMALSGDPVLRECYLTPPDPYLNTAIKMGVAPAGTLKSDPIRSRMKVFSLATFYGGGVPALSRALQERSRSKVRAIRARHRQVFSAFWRWSDGVVRRAREDGYLMTRAGWPIWNAADLGQPTLRDWLVQATGGDVMRVATVAMLDAKLMVCALVHDGFLVECAADEIEATVSTIDQTLRGATRAVIDVDVPNDFKVVRPGQRFLEPEGRPLWEAVMAALGRVPAPGYESSMEEKIGAPEQHVESLVTQ